MKREFLQLANTYSPGQNIGGWYVSEKLDGTRCFWDGGVSRGMKTVDVPYASVIDPKKGGYKAKIKPVATGLWSRYGNPIMAPDSFLDKLPLIPLDGELWAGRGNFQLCRSICAGDDPDPRFDAISYVVYSLPSPSQLFAPGQIKNANMVLEVDKQHRAWFEALAKNVVEARTFEEELDFLRIWLCGSWQVVLHNQIKLSPDNKIAEKEVEEFAQSVLSVDGEGVVLRNPQATWTPKRHNGILKYKPVRDDEAVLVGFTSGRETDKGSKNLGKIGALITNYNGKRLDLSGMTDEEREFETSEMADWAATNPGVVMPPHVQGRHFKLGQKITFTYRELSDDGIPREARYLRIRSEE